MTRKKVKLALIESITERKASYKKRQKGFFKKAQEVSILCDVETAIVIYSPYHNEPEVYPNHAAVINTFTKFRELPELEQSKNMETQVEFTKQRIKKLKEQLRKVRKENRVKQFTSKMYEVLNGEDIPADMHPYDLNDLSYVINQNLKRVYESIKVMAGGEGSTSNVPQPIAGLMVPDVTNSEGPSAPLFTPPVAPLSVVPLVAPSMVPGGTSSKGLRAPLMVPVMAPKSLVPPVAPSMVPLVASAPTQVPQPMFHSVAPLRTPQTVSLVDPSRVPPPFPSFSSEMFPPVFSQLYPPIPQQMALRRAPGMAPPMPPSTIASLMPSPMMAPPMSAPGFPPMTPRMDPSMNVPPLGASMLMSNYQNYSYGFPQSPELSEMLNWDDDVLTLFDDPFFNNINVQDPNHNNNNF
ncbi:hypothetical protein RND71_016115 [Anisodus tanguticus]|uniref:MADS-box domain-containing protein n=1 Tax=Anisodus tanguticus TaxID=243964 RepID=A0AAE1S8B1_9SOLA|nr:hypothetical protein RND71_016115 [Anisodus tanguticus]